MATPISWDLDVSAEQAVAAFDDAIAAMQRTKAESERVTAALGGIEAAAEKAGLTTEQAAKLIEKSVRRAADEAAAAQRRMASEALKSSNSFGDIAKRLNQNQTISQLETISALFIQMGGNVSQVASIVTSLIRPVATVGEFLKKALGPSAPLLLGLAAIPVATAAAVFGLKALGDTAVDAIKELDKMGRAAEVPPEARKAMRDYEVATQELTVALLSLKAALADDVLPPLTRMATTVHLLINATDELEKKVRGMADVHLPNFVQAFLETSEAAVGAESEFGKWERRIATLGMNEVPRLAAALNDYVDAQTRATRAAESDRLERERQIDVWQRQAEEEENRRKESGKRAQQAVEDAKREAKQVAEEAERLAKREAEASRKAAQTRERLIEDNERAIQEEKEKSLEKQREAEQKYLDWWRGARLDAIEANANASAAYIEQVLKDSEAETAAFEDQLELKQEATKEAIGEIATAWTDFFAQMAELNLQHEEEELERLARRTKNAREELGKQWEHFREVARDMTKEQRTAYRQQTKADRDRTRDAIASLEEQKEAQRKAVREAFALTQAAAVASVLTQGAVAFVSMMAGLATALGPGAIAAPIIAGAIVGPTVAAQVAQIASQKPPAHDGRVFGADEFFVGNQMVRDGERGTVLNQRAVEQGGVEQVEELNRGRAAGATSGPARLVLEDSGRVIGEAVVSQLQQPTSRLARAVGSRQRGYSDPFRRGR